MKKLAFLGAMALASGAFAQFADHSAGNLRVEHHWAPGETGGYNRVSAGIDRYDNTANFQGAAIALGGSANQAGNQITRMLMDDVQTSGAIAGEDVLEVTFSVYNGNTTNVSTRARIRFWFADGAGGNPGTYYNLPAAVGFTFNAFSFAPGVTLLTGTLAAGSFTMPTGPIWAGITFDNNAGATGATAAQMDNFGQGLFGAPVLGTSNDVMFATTAAGSFFTTPNPAGSQFNFAGTGLLANAGWRLAAVPEPGTMIALGAGLAALAARRRRK